LPPWEPLFPGPKFGSADADALSAAIVPQSAAITIFRFIAAASFRRKSLTNLHYRVLRV
jgi:hypothetical protein